MEAPAPGLTSTTKDANPMIEADSVLSTPPLNSSSIQDTNVPLGARGESVDSFSHQPAIIAITAST